MEGQNDVCRCTQLKLTLCCLASLYHWVFAELPITKQVFWTQEDRSLFLPEFRHCLMQTFILNSVLLSFLLGSWGKYLWHWWWASALAICVQVRWIMFYICSFFSIFYQGNTDYWLGWGYPQFIKLIPVIAKVPLLLMVPPSLIFLLCTAKCPSKHIALLMLASRKRKAEASCLEQVVVHREDKSALLSVGDYWRLVLLICSKHTHTLTHIHLCVYVYTYFLIMFNELLFSHLHTYTLLSAMERKSSLSLSTYKSFCFYQVSCQQNCTDYM